MGKGEFGVESPAHTVLTSGGGDGRSLKGSREGL